MRIRHLAVGVELGAAALWVVLSLVAWFGGSLPLHILTWDFVVLVGFVVAVRWPRMGILLVCLLLIAGLCVDPGGHGLATYIGATAIVLAVRRGAFSLATLLSTVTLSTWTVLVIRRVDEQPGDVVATVVAAGILVSLAWLIGFGFRWVARVEGERVSKQYVERQMRMAVDIHDFVSRNLAGLLLREEQATAEERTEPEFLEELVARVRNADATLREVTADLQREGTAKSFQVLRADEAARVGVDELETSGFEVAAGDVEAALSGLPSDVDLVVSRVVAEALHNVVKHGDKSHPCRIGVARSATDLEVVVTNAVKGRAAPASRRLGLVGMGRHARLVGGTVRSRPRVSSGPVSSRCRCFRRSRQGRDPRRDLRRRPQHPAGA